MSEWVDNFLEKHAKKMHSGVLDRVNHNSSQQQNIERFMRELSHIDAKTSDLIRQRSELLVELAEALRIAHIQNGALSLPKDHPLVIKYLHLQDECRWSDLIAQETCQLIQWLEDEVQQ